LSNGERRAFGERSPVIDFGRDVSAAVGLQIGLVLNLAAPELRHRLVLAGLVLPSRWAALAGLAFGCWASASGADAWCCCWHRVSPHWRVERAHELALHVRDGLVLAVVKAHIAERLNTARWRWQASSLGGRRPRPR
jgi:hypothetical protein